MRSLEFSPDGTRLIVAAADHLQVVDLAHRTSRELARTRLVAFTMVGDEIWSVAGSPATLEVDGHAERLQMPGTHGRLVRGVGTQAAWLGAGLAIHLVRTATGVDAMPYPDADFALPLSATRMIVCQQSAIRLRDATRTWWTAPAQDGRVIDGAVVFDGRAVALYLAQRGGHGVIVVLDARTGALQHRIKVSGATTVRFAARRGVAVIAIERRRLVLIDLRFGRILANHAIDREIAELAIDDTAHRIAMRYDELFGEVVELDADQLLRPLVQTLDVDAPTTCAVTDDPPDAGLVSGPPPAIEPPPAAARPPRALAAIPALPARMATSELSAGTLREQTEAQRGLVIALICHAIACAWDEGRAAPDRAAPLRAQLDGLTGTLHGLAVGDLMQTAARLDEAFSRAWAVIAVMAPQVAPIHQLADELGLSDLEQHILLVVAAPAMWGELARLYAILVDDPRRATCDEHLVASALATLAFPHEIAAALDPEGPLVRRGLLHVGQGAHRPFLPLTIDPIVLRLLRGASPRDELGAGISVRPATRTFDELHLRDDVARHIADELVRAPAPLRIVVRGRAGSGRHTLLATIAETTGRQLGVIDAAAILRGADPWIDDLRRAMLRAELAGLMPCLVGLERSALQQPVLRDQIRELIGHHPGPLAVRLPADAQVPIEPGYIAIDLPAQTVSERTATWIASLERTGLEIPEPGDLATRFAIGPGVIERVVEHVAHDPGPHPTARVEATIRQHLDTELSAIATRVGRLPGWSQVILPPDIQDSVTELIGRIRHKRTVFDTWGFDRMMSTSRGLTALFEGGPGTGKTLVAGAIANELGLDLYRVDVSRIMSKWIGETEQNLGKLFDAAQDGNAILLFDEADSLFAKRTEVKSSNDRFANLEVNYLLQRLDSFEGIAILTTNFGTAIDPAFKRRLSFRLTFPFPDEDQRERLWRAHLPPQLPVRGELGLGEIARRYQLSGGYIRNCALRAAFLAAEQGGTMTADHLEHAIKAEFREIGKLSASGILE